MGPVWTYWAFPMERFCGKLLRCIKSRRHPFANIDSYITAVAQLDQIKNRYNAHKDLALLPPNKESSWEFRIEECNFFLYILAQGLSVLIILIDPTSVLCFPRQKNPTIPEGLLSKIIVTLVTRYNTTRTIIKRHLNVNEIEIWGKIRRLEGGDTMRAVQVSRPNTEDNRDASYVRVRVFFFGTLFILSS